nr:unnamed protein product [Spirometra erinaceieuropaei]
MLDARMSRMVGKSKEYDNCNETKSFFAQITAVCGPQTKEIAPLLSSDGIMFPMEKFQILKRWTEHFRSILNCPFMISDAAGVNGLKQDCVLVPALFNLLFYTMLLDFYYDKSSRILTVYRIDGHLLNNRCIQASTCLSMTTIHDLPYANDRALNTETDSDMQRRMELLASGCANFGLTINTDKTVVKPQSSATLYLLFRTYTSNAPD